MSKMCIRDRAYTLLIDGQAVAADVPLLYQGGGVGLITAAAQVGFDDVRVEPFTAAATSAPEVTSIPDACLLYTSRCV